MVGWNSRFPSFQTQSLPELIESVQRTFLTSSGAGWEHKTRGRHSLDRKCCWQSHQHNSRGKKQSDDMSLRKEVQIRTSMVRKRNKMKGKLAPQASHLLCQGCGFFSKKCVDTFREVGEVGGGGLVQTRTCQHVPKILQTTQDTSDAHK